MCALWVLVKQKPQARKKQLKNLTSLNKNIRKTIPKQQKIKKENPKEEQRQQKPIIENNI